MVNNRDIDKLIVQKVFEMSQAGNSHTEIGDFFHRSRRWAQNILHNYSKETFSPVSVKKRGPQRKTTQEEDQLIIQKAREKAHAPVRAVLGELNSPIKKKISRRTAARRLSDAGARMQKEQAEVKTQILRHTAQYTAKYYSKTEGCHS